MTSRPFQVLVKPTGAACNLDCSYCFFLTKEALYPGSSFRMSDETLELYLKQLIDAQPGPQVQVAFQGGEPTLMGIEFFERAVAIANDYLGAGRTASYTIQTNGVLIDDRWASFFAGHGFLVGVSIDGPEAIHDLYRVNKGGQGSFRQVLKGYRKLQQHEVDVNILCTVHAGNQHQPRHVYRFFRDELQARFIQFIPIVERDADAGVNPRSVDPLAYGDFLVDIFEEWARHDVGTVYVQMFDVTLGSYVGTYSLCVHAPACGDGLALEHTGDLYSCDHFVDPQHLLGNIADTPMDVLIDSPDQRTFGRDKRTSLPQMCLDCEVRSACHGGCPKDRFLTTPDGEPGLNYLCEGFKRFFGHTTEPMRFMASQLQAGRPPAAIMDRYAQQDRTRGRNDPCSCRSGHKFKRCHGDPTRGQPRPQIGRPPTSRCGRQGLQDQRTYLRLLQASQSRAASSPLRGTRYGPVRAVVGVLLGDWGEPQPCAPGGSAHRGRWDQIG